MSKTSMWTEEAFMVKDYQKTHTHTHTHTHSNSSNDMPYQVPKKNAKQHNSNNGKLLTSPN